MFVGSLVCSLVHSFVSSHPPPTAMAGRRLAVVRRTALRAVALRAPGKSCAPRALFLGSHTYSVRAFCFGRRVCRSVCRLSVPRQISKIRRDGREISSPLYRKSGSPSKNMTSDFSPAKKLNTPNLQTAPHPARSYIILSIVNITYINTNIQYNIIQYMR